MTRLCSGELRFYGRAFRPARSLRPPSIFQPWSLYTIAVVIGLLVLLLPAQASVPAPTDHVGLVGRSGSVQRNRTRSHERPGCPIRLTRTPLHVGFLSYLKLGTLSLFAARRTSCPPPFAPLCLLSRFMPRHGTCFAARIPGCGTPQPSSS
ncbi:hypothetical protein EDB89DRAFT_1981668 [Lactarius sanguifluus]|nr:hypothetical protein EDB89DRAFT_1981668 [Lactarius sanguifluus]